MTFIYTGRQGAEIQIKGKQINALTMAYVIVESRFDGIITLTWRNSTKQQNVKQKITLSKDTTTPNKQQLDMKLFFFFGLRHVQRINKQAPG
jgi:hypothetical protein